MQIMLLIMILSLLPINILGRQRCAEEEITASSCMKIKVLNVSNVFVKRRESYVLIYLLDNLFFSGLLNIPCV